MSDTTTSYSRDARAAVAGSTHPGRRREENQDTFLVADLNEGPDALILRPGSGDAVAAAAGEIGVGERGLLLMVADGMGGAAGGRLASGLACSFVVAQLQEGWRQDPDRSPALLVSRLREAVDAANRRVHDHARRNPEFTGMGTTVTAAALLDGVVYVAQVGDSRAYLVRAHAATQLTRDQSFVQQLVEAGALTEEEASRSSHGHLVLQAVGVEPEIEVVLTCQPLRRGDWLILCSDGLHRVIGPEEMARIVSASSEPGRLCGELVTLANARGGPDNVTVVAAHLQGTALDEPGPGDAVAATPCDPTEPVRPEAS
jgi:PPM family protein phosphatase